MRNDKEKLYVTFCREIFIKRNRVDAAGIPFGLQTRTENKTENHIQRFLYETITHSQFQTWLRLSGVFHRLVRRDTLARMVDEMWNCVWISSDCHNPQTIEPFGRNCVMQNFCAFYGISNFILVELLSLWSFPFSRRSIAFVESAFVSALFRKTLSLFSVFVLRISYFSYICAAAASIVLLFVRVFFWSWKSISSASLSIPIMEGSTQHTPEKKRVFSLFGFGPLCDVQYILVETTVCRYAYERYENDPRQIYSVEASIANEPSARYEIVIRSYHSDEHFSLPLSLFSAFWCTLSDGNCNWQDGDKRHKLLSLQLFSTNLIFVLHTRAFSID